MTLAYTVFGFYLLVIIVGAGFAVFNSNLVRALVGLVFAFMGVAGMYILMQAPFLAFMQLLIYVGAICVLIFFALMLAQADGSISEEERRLLREMYGYSEEELESYKKKPARRTT